MIQFNLLPDVKLEYAKAQKTKRAVFVIAFIASATCLTILIMLFTVVNVFQKKHLSDVNADIKSNISKLESIKDLDKILTVQNQLVSLTCAKSDSKTSCLHDNKPVVSRLFGFLAKIVPKKVKISVLDIDYALNTMKFTGTTSSLGDVNEFVDTLKFTQYKDASNNNVRAFTNVVLTSFDNAKGGFNFTISLSNDPQIFNSQAKINLDVPKNKVTTRSAIEKPSASDLFNEQFKPVETNNP